MKRWNRPLLICATIFFFLSLPLAVGWAFGEFAIFWTAPGAALIQAFGCAAACIWGAWLLRDKPLRSNA